MADYEMSRVEVLEQKLRDAQAENEQLREELGRRKRQPAFPDDAFKDFPLLEGLLYQKNRVLYKQKDYSAIEAFCLPLSRIIRGTLFPETAKPGRTKERYIVCQEMNPEQYAAFKETLHGVLSALDAGRRKVKEGLQ